MSENISIKVSNYKCFKYETGFDSIKRANLIIGKNNVGKSALLDIIEIVVEGKYEFDNTSSNEGCHPCVIFESLISSTAVSRAFRNRESSDNIRGNHYKYASQLIGRKIKWKKINRYIEDMEIIDCDDSDINPRLVTDNGIAYSLLKNMPICIENKKFKRISAERDITPEKHEPRNLKILSNASGLTNTIASYLVCNYLPSNLVKEKIFSDLNSIYADEANFSDISCEMNEDDNYEIYLNEKHKGSIPLSKSGSGLKTVITILAFIHLVPHIEGRKLNRYVFGFEELENNLHPSLLRRLNEFINRKLGYPRDEFNFFITTHSNILIDYYLGKKNAQIIHVERDGSASKCTTASSYVNSIGILNDLGFKASDLLQSNGIIWVEGPSDVIFINKWIELWSDSKFINNYHYQVLFYGGRLLSHIDANEPRNLEQLISIFSLNRHAIILMDSDRKHQHESINSTKTRVMEKFEEMNALSWITEGLEIENYIPSSSVDKAFRITNSPQVDPYLNFYDHLDKLIPGEGKKYKGKKILLAEKVVPHMTKADLKKVLNIEKQMNKVVDAIKKWN